MGRGQNKRKYAKLYFLHAQMGITPKQAHSLVVFFFPHPLLYKSFGYSARLAGTRACGRSGITTEHFASQSLVAFVQSLFSLPWRKPAHQCCHCPALLGSINTGSKFWLRDNVLQGDLQRPRTFHLPLLLPVPSSQDSPECHLVYSFLSLSGDWDSLCSQISSTYSLNNAQLAFVEVNWWNETTLVLMAAA